MELDHVLVAVADLDAAVRQYEAILGLSTSVRCKHPAYGTRNALFLFERGPYLELLALGSGSDGSGEPAIALRAFLAERGEGLMGVALTPPAMDAAIVRLRELGFKAPEAAHGTAVNSDGRVREWRGTRLPGAALHNAMTLLIEHRGWDWRRELRQAPKAARSRGAAFRIHHVVFDVPDADAASKLWNERFGLTVGETVESVRMGARVLVHPAGAANLEAVAPTTEDGAVAQRMARHGEGLSGIAFQVRDLDAAYEAVCKAGISATAPAPGVIPRSMVVRIDRASACGVPAQLIQIP